MMGTARWTYNQCVEAITTKHATLTKKSLRAHCVNSDAERILEKGFEWVTDTPYEIRDQAMEDALDAFKINLNLQKAGKRPKGFCVNFRRKGFRCGSFKIIKKLWSSGEIAPRKVGMGPFRSSEPLPLRLNAEASLIQEAGNWYITLVKEVKEREPSSFKRITNKGRICSIDPGVRTFATVYDPIDNKVYKWGDKDASYITKLCLKMDGVIGKMTRVKAKVRYNMKKAVWRIRSRIKNVVNEFHKKFVTWLSTNYEYILVPTFNAHQMCGKRKRKINNKVVRSMLNWCHGRFRERLNFKSGLCRQIPVLEAHTSQACSECGHLWRNLKGQKIYKCQECRSVMDRDCNGAKNIFMRWLITTSEASQSP